MDFGKITIENQRFHANIALPPIQNEYWSLVLHSQHILENATVSIVIQNQGVGEMYVFNEDGGKIFVTPSSKIVVAPNFFEFDGGSRIRINLGSYEKQHIRLTIEGDLSDLISSVDELKVQALRTAK